MLLSFPALSRCAIHGLEVLGPPLIVATLGLSASGSGRAERSGQCL